MFLFAAEISPPVKVNKYSPVIFRPPFVISVFSSHCMFSVSHTTMFSIFWYCDGISTSASNCKITPSERLEIESFGSFNDILGVIYQVAVSKERTMSSLSETSLPGPEVLSNPAVPVVLPDISAETIALEPFSSCFSLKALDPTISVEPFFVITFCATKTDPTIAAVMTTTERNAFTLIKLLKPFHFFI